MTTIDGLRRKITTTELEIKKLRVAMKKLEKSLAGYQKKLDQMELDAFLAKHNASQIHIGAKLQVCEEFYQLMESRRYSRAFTDQCYGQGAVIQAFFNDDDTFYIYEADRSGGIGGIPLNVILAMHKAAQS